MSPIGSFEFTARLWLHPGSGGWHFVTLPADVAEDVTDLTAGLRHGFGSVRVAATVGATSWRTSIFPDRDSGSFVLPMKKPVRAAERLVAGQQVRLRLDLVDL